MTDPTTSTRLTFEASKEVVFSSDGSKVYVATASGGKVEAYSTATGALLSSWNVGKTLGGMDVTPDGRYIVAAEREPVASTLDQYGSRTYTITVHRLDTVTGEVRNYNYTPGFYDYTFFDVAVLANGKVLLSQSFSGSGWVNLKTLDLDTGIYTQLSQSVRQDSVLSISADRTHIFVGEANISSAQIDEFVLKQDGTLGLVGSNGSSGFNRGVQALSPDAHLAANFVYGVGVLLFDSNLAYSQNLTNRFPDWRTSVSGLTFDATGEHLLVLDYVKEEVFSLSTTTWQIVGSYTLDPSFAEDSPSGQFGNQLLINANGYVTVVSDSGVQLLTPDAFHEVGVQVAGTVGDDQLTGRSGNDTLDGLNGADILMGLAGDDILNGGAGNDLLDGGWGADKMFGGSGDDRYIVGNIGDVVTEQVNEGTDTVETSITYTLSANVENLIAQTGANWYNGGPDGNIDLTGNALNNRIAGNAGNNIIAGGDGDDVLSGGGGHDRIDGGAGTDTLVLSHALGSYMVLQAGDSTFLIGPGETYRVTGVEQLRVGDGPSVSLANAVAQITPFDGLRYIAGQPDLLAVLGADAAGGAAHFAATGFNEGRDPLAFDPYSYLASYSDLRAAFGTDAAAASRHYVTAGAAEGRTVSFDALNYIATYSDLRATFGTDASAAARHFLVSGEAEGRVPGFDTYGYLASNRSVLEKVGHDIRAAEREYIEEGAALGYRTDGFDALSYIASYSDLTAAFGTNATAGVRHFVDRGFAEGREISFEALSYIASYDDLIDAFGANAAAGASHFLGVGATEGRGVTFDPEAYAQANPDVLAVYGHDHYGLAQHYILWGHDEGRHTAPPPADMFGIA